MSSLCQRDYHDELFCGSDDGDPDCLYWVSADGRAEQEAIALVERFVGRFEDGALVSPVTGYVEQTTDGPYFHKSAVCDDRFWEVTSR